MFRLDQCGRLSYAPFRSYQLPELVYVTFRDKHGEGVTFVPFKRRHESEPDFSRKLYQLRWPGETDREWSVPMEGLPEQTARAIAATWQKGSGCSHASGWEIRQAFEAGHPMPEALAYHLAVNPLAAKVGQPAPSVPAVAGLPQDRVAQVVNARFCFDSNALATLAYLKWMAESHYQHPFFQGFDTNIRETLYELQHEAVRLYFYLLADYRYDMESQWWDRSMSRFVWQRLATYLHWVGRTGRALYGSLSHINPAEGIRPDVVEKHMQDVVDGDRAWIHTAIDRVPDIVEEDPAK
jgi:hypothetical protein